MFSMQILLVDNRARTFTTTGQGEGIAPVGIYSRSATPLVIFRHRHFDALIQKNFHRVSGPGDDLGQQNPLGPGKLTQYEISGVGDPVLRTDANP